MRVRKLNHLTDTDTNGHTDTNNHSSIHHVCSVPALAAASTLPAAQAHKGETNDQPPSGPPPCFVCLSVCLTDCLSVCLSHSLTHSLTSNLAANQHLALSVYLSLCLSLTHSLTLPLSLTHTSKTSQRTDTLPLLAHSSCSPPRAAASDKRLPSWFTAASFACLPSKWSCTLAFGLHS